MNSSKLSLVIFIILVLSALCIGQTTYGYVGVPQGVTLSTSLNSQYNFKIKGGDGGWAKAGNCIAGGGNGAISEFTVTVGNGSGQVPPGTKLRFIVGQRGFDYTGDNNTGSRGGGGGGTGVLAEIDGEWVTLSVAGGGGGAYRGSALGFCVDYHPGEGGRTNTSGGDGVGTYGGDAGTNGNGGNGGGDANFGWSNLSGGGGGAYSGGTGSNELGGSNHTMGGGKGLPSGGEGGATTQGGGYGFGGGGAGNQGGGGGGGYSGGGGGSENSNGGGGGSYNNNDYVSNGRITAYGHDTDTRHGYIQFSLVCDVSISGFNYINPLCTSDDQGRIQFDYSIAGDDNCENKLIWSLEPLNGWQYLGDGTFRSMRAGNYSLNIYNTDVDMTVASYDFTVAPNGIPPEARCKDVTVTLEDGLYSNPDFGSLINDGSTSFCDEPLLFSASTTNFDCTDGTEFVLLTVTGHNGATATCSSTVTVVLPEEEASIAICKPGFQVNLSNGNIPLAFSDIDNGSLLSLCWLDRTISHSEITCNEVGSLDVVLTIEDFNGSISECTTTINVVDPGTPTVVCNDVLTLVLDVSGNVSLDPADLSLNSLSNNCTDLSYSATIQIFDCYDLGSNEVTLTVTDGYGRSSSCETTVEVTQVTSPIAVCQDITVSLDDNGSYSLNPAELDNGSSAGCTTCEAGCTPSLSSSLTNFDCDDIGEHLVTLTVTSAPGVTISCQATVTVIDDTPPVAYCANPTVTLSRSGVATIGNYRSQWAQLATDNCGNLSSINFIGGNLLYCEDLGITEVLFEVVDAHENRDTCTALFTVLDDIRDPIINCQQDYSVELDDTGTYTFSEDDLNSILENSITRPGCAGGSVLDTLASQMTFDCEDLDTPISVQFTITQEGSSAASCSTTINVVDDVSPICQTAVVQLEIKAMLSGPYDPASGLMDDQLRVQGLLPLASPYPNTTAITTAAVLTTTGANAIVDWVLIELRDDQDSGAVLYSRAALLQRDGDIVGTDGISAVRFPDAANGDYYVAVQHRNHLGIMKNTPVEVIKSIPID